MKSKVQRKTPAPKVRKRNPARTRETILQAAVAEFCRNGFTGARVETISARSGANMRLLYHYFGDKDGLYMAALDRVYTQVRAAERKLDLGKVDPVEGMSRLIDFTFEFFAAHPEYVSLAEQRKFAARPFRQEVARGALTHLAAARDDHGFARARI